MSGKSTIGSFIWSGVERFGSVLLTFLFNWILARFFLSPEDFGLLGMLYVFIALANTTVIGGFGQALIQKKEPTKSDYDTVFIWNVLLAIILYVVLYFLAPYISSFYEIELLSPLLRILSLSLIINSLIVVQNNLLIKQLNFKKLSAINLSASLFGYLIGLFFAYKGYGVWCLVANTLSIQAFQVLFLWGSAKWRPSLKFSYSSFKELFGFGGFMYLSTLFETVYNNISYFIIGKMFSPTLLGYYTQAEKLQSVPTTTLSNIVNQVAFPLFSSAQDNRIKLSQLIKRQIEIIAFLNSSLMILLVLIASPLILWLFTEKWAQSIWIFQILCLSGLFLPLNISNTTLLKSLGKGKLFLYLQLIKRTLGILLIVGAAMLGMNWMLYAICICPFLFFLINIVVTSKYIPYPCFLQLADIIKAMLIPTILGLVVYFLFHYIHFNSLIMTVLVVSFLYVLGVVLCAKIVRFSPYLYLYSTIKGKIFQN